MSGNAVSISVPGYPTNNLVPGVYFGVDASQADTAQVPQRTLIIGQILSSGTYAAGIAVLAGSVQDVRVGAGVGSMLALMFEAYNEQDSITEVWLLPLLDDSASVKASGTIAFSGTTTSVGVLSFYMAGELTALAVSSGETAAAIVTALTPLVNGNPELPATLSGAATVSSVTTATFTALNGGLVGNDIDMQFNYFGAAGGEAMPPGLTATITHFASGAQNPTALSTALANLGDMPFDFICCSYTDTTSLNTIQSFLAGRWGLTQEIFGHAFSAFRGSPSQRTTFSATRNDPHTSIIGFYNSPSPVWAWAAWLTGAASASVASGAGGIVADPALPIKGMVIHALAPPLASRDTFSTRQTMLQNGMGTYLVDHAGEVTIERIPTTYTTNPATGAPDNSYQSTETDYQLMACIRDMRIQLQNQFARKKLVADGSLIPGGSNMVTSQTILDAAKARYLTQCNQFGWCQNPAVFNQKALAENAGGGVVFLLLPFMLANQLWVIAANVQFTKP
jgi:phage tail sheath gpL-like